MNQQQLIFIREIARTGTIRGAAACVDRTPSALTRGLKSVENELGCQLFRRIREGMVPTSEGETVLSYGERILKSLQEIKEKRIWSENEIRYLLCIRENKSITGAAETLFIAQPSLSQVLKEVEEEVGFKIFQRDRRGAEETKAGAELLEQLEEVWKLWKEMREELGEYRELKKGCLIKWTSALCIFRKHWMKYAMMNFLRILFILQCRKFFSHRYRCQRKSR